MNSHFHILNVDNSFIDYVYGDENKEEIIKRDFLPVLENKFDQCFEITNSKVLDQGFQILIENPSLIFGLNNENGRNIIWIPIDDKNKKDHNIFKSSEKEDEIESIFRKYNIIFWNRDRMNEIRKEIIDHPLFLDRIPYYLDKFEKGKCLYLTKNVIITNNKKYKYDSDYKILKIDLKESDKKFQKIQDISFDNYINKPTKNPLGLIVSCKGDYNEKTFEKSFLSFRDLNFDSLFLGIKKTLNTRYREILLDTTILEKKENISLNLDDFKFEESKWLIQNYFQNYSFDFKNNNPDYIYTEKIENTWEEYDTDDIYDEITFFNCKFRITVLL